jgi:cbb3-type cytochrome oxidase maturation protein
MVGDESMNILWMMIPLALILSGSFLGAFLWAAHRGQFDDTMTPAHRILNDDQQREELR